MENRAEAKSDKKPLSSRTIATMKPGDGFKADTGENTGLRVRCGNSGVKTFMYRYRSPVTQKLCQVLIGHYPQMSLAEARIKLQELKQIRQLGRCPATEAKAEKKLAEAEQVKHQTVFTVEDMVELYLTEYIEDRMVNGKRVSGARKPKGQDETRRTLHNDPVRALGGREARTIKRKDVSELILEIVKRGSNVQAGNVLREFSAAFEFSIGMDRFDENFTNPCISAKASLKRLGISLTHQRGKRYLSDEELKKFLEWLPGSVFTPTQKNILRFSLWTGCRSGEVCSAEWKDIDLDKAIWHLRETKTGAERTVQLPKQAVDFLRQLKLTTGDYPFPSQKTGLPIQQKAITEQAWHLRQTKRMLDIAHWSPHDLRRTVRTGLSRLRCPNEVAEAIMGHSRKGIEGTYDLHTYEDECREWLQKWADYLDGLQ